MRIKRQRALVGGAMGKVLTHMRMSLDGYIADPHDQPGELFDWYAARCRFAFGAPRTGNPCIRSHKE